MTAKVQILGASLLAITLAAGVGVALSQGTPGSQSDKKPCTAHPCEGYVYDVHYNMADGAIISAGAQSGGYEGAQPQGWGVMPQAGTAVIILSDPDQIRLLAGLLADSNAQDYYVDLTALTLKKRPESVAPPSATAQSSAWPFRGLGVLPPLALTAGIGLSLVALASARRRTSR